MEYLWRHVKDSFLMGEGEKVRREDPKKSKTGNKLKQDQVQRWKATNYPSAVGLFFTCIGAPIALFIRWVMGKVPSHED